MITKCDEYIRVGGQQVCLTHTNKLLFPGIKKREIIEYYRKMAPRMVPEMKDRVLTLQRYTEGIKKGGFFMKKHQQHYPSFVKTRTLPLKAGTQQKQILCNNTTTLVYLSNQDAIVYHVWPSKIDAINKPDRMIIDLDCDNFALVKQAAYIVKTELAKKKLTAFVMLTGSRGLHITIPIKRQYTFDRVRYFLRAFCKSLTNKYPDVFTMQVRRAKRRGKVFLDYARNSYGQTTVAPYSIRPYPGAPVAMPVSWSALKTIESARHYNIKTAPDVKGNPWKGMQRRAGVLKFSKK